MAIFGNLARSRKGSEAVETGLVTIGLMIAAAAVVVIFTVLLVIIAPQLIKGESKSTQESFSLLVNKLKAMDDPGFPGNQVVGHALYLGPGYYLFGFDYKRTDISWKGGGAVRASSPLQCVGTACVCMCASSSCDQKAGLVECNRGIGESGLVDTVKLQNIKSFAVRDSPPTDFNRGVANEGIVPLAIFGDWGGGVLGFGRKLWPQGKVIYLKRSGSVIEVTMNEPKQP